MCGIVGYISTYDLAAQKEKRHFMDWALTLDSLRGMDSTGLIMLRDNFQVSTAHTTASGRRYVQMDHYKEQIDKPAWAVIGHNRAATAGSVKLENAHPFTFGDVTLVHNGTLYNRGKSMPGYDPALEVDSMLISKAFSEVEPDEIPKVLKQIDGSYCLVWVDKRDESINVCRNTSRPFHFCFNKGRNIMWFMSDGHHLNTINRSLGTSWAAGEEIYLLDKHKWLKWTKGSMVPEVTEFDPFVQPKQTHYPKQTYQKELDRELKAWQNKNSHKNTRGSKGNGPTYGTEKTVFLNGQWMSVPRPQAAGLEQYFDLDVGDLVEFEPSEFMVLEDKKCRVTGYFCHEEWGEAEWPMVLYDVPQVIAEAYSGRNWMVRCKGLTHPDVDWGMEDIPSVRGELFHHDAQRYLALEAELEEKHDKKEEEINKDTGLVLGPEDRLMPYGRLMEHLSHGCVQCGAKLVWEKKEKYMFVNENRDLLCDQCVAEWDTVTGEAM